MITIAELFESYRKKAIHAGASETQILETRRAFFAGSYIMLELLLDNVGSDTVSEDQGVERLETLRRECEAFVAVGGTVTPSPPDVQYTVPDPLEIQGMLRELAERISSGLPVGWGFMLMLFKYGEGGDLFYISSADRADVLGVLREFIKRQTQ